MLLQEDLSVPYGAESMLMMVDRWTKLERALYKPPEHPDKGGVFDCSQIPDVYDSVKFDLIHNSHLNCDYSRVRLPTFRPVHMQSTAAVDPPLRSMIRLACQTCGHPCKSMGRFRS